MKCCPRSEHRRIVVDSIHGDIELTPQEWRIVDTASFQRLRYIKQLGMAHLVYPNATHTRFSHSIGALRIMQRILQVADSFGLPLDRDTQQRLRLAALLHDVGHYPYSHLMEGIDKVVLAEQFVDGVDAAKQVFSSPPPYPQHVRCGELAVKHQQDLIEEIGGEEEAARVADLFSRGGAADPQLSKFVSSSLDMDRLDYLLRDARAAGVPYGEIDLNYLLNSFRVSKDGVVGISTKALPAAEHYLFARYCMHRAVYHHRTVHGFEEAARHLIRRIRDRDPKRYDLPADGREVEACVVGDGFKSFTDSFLDRLMLEAVDDPDPMVSMTARALRERRPPRRLREIVSLHKTGTTDPVAARFEVACRAQLRKLAESHRVALDRFIFSRTRPLSVEKHLIDDGGEQNSELLRVIEEGGMASRPLVDVDESVVRLLDDFDLSLLRLYVIDDSETETRMYERLRNAVSAWGT
ncbi:MAG: HD domain-containing protein [Phycisphaerae bacterium]|jgi:HD superfamily phosphohydrolase